MLPWYSEDIKEKAREMPMKRVILFLLVCLLLLGCSAKAPVEQEADNTPRIEEDTPEK